jgi:hypothetical protein
MFNFTNIVIICIFLVITYFIYQLMIDNIKIIKKMEDALSNKIEDIIEKNNEMNDMIELKIDQLNIKIKESYDLNFKMNELHILNNQKILEKHDYKDEDVDDNEKSPITENFFIKHTKNKDKNLYYMSPIQKSSKNSPIDTILSKETLSKITSNDNIFNENKFDEYTSTCLNSISDNDLNNNSISDNDLNNNDLSDNDLSDNGLSDNYLNYNDLNDNISNLNILNLNFLNIIKDNNENDCTKIKKEDRFEEL